MFRYLNQELFRAGLACLVFATTSAVAGEVDQLLGRLDELRREHQISALGLVLVDLKSGPLALNHIGGLGTLSHDSDVPITPDTVFRLGSITKSFTALTFLRLHQQGHLGLQDPLSRHIPQDLWRNPWADTTPVTLEQLLEHSAGFADISRAEFDIAVPLPLTDALRRFAPGHVVRWQPGLYSSYTNLGPGLAGLAMVKATGRPYETLVQQELLEPLGMRRSGFDPALVEVAGYNSDGVTPIPYWHMVYRPFGALNASLADMAPFLRLQLGHGVVAGEVLLDRQLFDRAERAGTTLAARNGLAFGDGLGRYPWLRDGVLFMGHGGDADGYLSRYGYSHELGRAYFLVINAFQGRVLREMRALVERSLIRGHQPKPQPTTQPVDPAKFAWVPGAYRPQTGRFNQPGELVRFRLHQGRIEYRGSSGWVRLLAVDIGTDRILLRYSKDNHATAVLLRDDDRNVYFIDSRRNLRRASD